MDIAKIWQYFATYCHTRLKLCSEEPEWVLKSVLTNPPTRLLDFFLCFVFVCTHLLCLSPPFRSATTYYVCSHLICLSPTPISVPTFYVCPHLLCLSPPTYYVCPHLFCLSHLLCLSPPFMAAVLLG